MSDWPALFDINGSIGYPAAASPEFAEPGDLLHHMDRLGVSRSLVWHTTARDQHPATGNQLLERMLAGQDRLVPVTVIGLDMLWERDGLTPLAAQTVRAVRLFPGTLRFNLESIIPVLAAVADQEPLLLLDHRELPGLPGLSRLAERFPRLPIAVTQAMWPDLGGVLDLMRRHENVLADISWLHTSGTIELLCRHFGASRVLFGLGGKAHQGASLGALLHAEIGTDERALIAHGNLDRLLRLPPTPPVQPRLASPLWARFVRGEPLGVEVLDAHGHLGPVGTWMQERQTIDDQLPQALRDMDRCSIRTLIVSSMSALFADPVAGNDELASKLAPHGDRFRGWIVFNPHATDRLAPHLDRWLANPFFIGFKLLCAYWRVPVTDARLEPVWRTANDRHLPILLHTWDDGYNSPAMLREICPRYPQAEFILGHAGGGDRGRREAEELVAANPNVWLEWCGSFCSSIPWEESLPRVGADRVLFGSDAVVHNFAWELGRLLSLDLPADVVRPVLGENLRRLLARRQRSRTDRET